MLRAFNAIQNLSNTERGLTRGAMRQLCISTVFSVSDYGSELWFRNQRTQVKSIQTIQNNVMRRVAGAFKTTSIKALEAEIELMPTTQRLAHKHRTYATRMLQVADTHPVRQCIDETEEDTQLTYVMSTLSDVDQNRLEEIKMFVHEPWYESKINTHIEQTSKTAETTRHQAREFNKNDLVMYTDGSMVESKVGAAVICRNNNQYE